MREILFRGKRLDNGKWVFGDIVQLQDSVFIHTYEHGCRVSYEIVNTTIGQFAELYDKNGKRIFEGDILKTTNSNCEIWFVDYKITSFCANQSNANYSCSLEEFMVVSEVEVIGNIFDNPELLENNRATS